MDKIAAYGWDVVPALSEGGDEQVKYIQTVIQFVFKFSLFDQFAEVVAAGRQYANIQWKIMNTILQGYFFTINYLQH